MAQPLQPKQLWGRPPEPRKSLEVVTPQGPTQADLLAFYKSRVDDFENERGTLLESVDRLGVQATEVHQVEWENRKRADEVRELQKALSDAHAFLFEERQRLLSLQAENDELRLQEIEDRKRIQQLLSAGGVPGRAPGKLPPQFAHYSVDALLLKIESLQAQLNEQKQLASERVAALLEDRRIREGEETAHRAHQVQQLEQMAVRVAKTEEQLRQTTKDYILAKRDKQAAEEKTISSETDLTLEQQRAVEEAAILKRRSDKELKDLRLLAESKLEDITTTLRQQLKSREDEVISLTSVHTALKSQYEKRLTELDDRVGKLTATNRQLETRRHQDMEGFQQDITYLRKMLTAVDRKLHEMRLVERLQDDERLDSILAGLRRKAPVPSSAPAGEGGRDVSAVSDTTSIKGGLAQGLDEMRGQLGGLQNRLHKKKAMMGR